MTRATCETNLQSDLSNSRSEPWSEKSFSKTASPGNARPEVLISSSLDLCGLCHPAFRKYSPTTSRHGVSSNFSIVTPRPTGKRLSSAFKTADRPDPALR